MAYHLVCDIVLNVILLVVLLVVLLVSAVMFLHNVCELLGFMVIICACWHKRFKRKTKL